MDTTTLPTGFPRLNISLSARPSTVVARLHRAAYTAADLPFTYSSIAVDILARDPSRALAMTRALGLPDPAMFTADTDLAGYDGVVNATPVGFHDATALPFAAQRLVPGQILFDAVVGTGPTRLVREAQAQGCRVVSGPRMLVHVIGEQIALYTGRPPDIAVLKRALQSGEGNGED
jgi:shikimate 5-dehydrogenase